MSNYFFKKKSRLLNSTNFKYVFSKPIIRNTMEISILGRFNYLKHARLGLSIPRKHIKYAHDRNLIKRLVRETFRLLQQKLIFMDFIVAVKKNVLFLTNNKIISTLISLWSSYHTVILFSKIKYN